MVAKQIATISLGGAGVRHQSSGGSKVSISKSFFHKGVWVTASGAEAEDETGYQMVEATCHR